MSHIIIIRPFKPGDEINCKMVIRDGVMSSLRGTFYGMIFKESVFQLMMLLCAVMFIFGGLSFTVCLLGIPIVILLVYISTYMCFIAKVSEIDGELLNIPRLYMSNAFSCFWVAEAFQPLTKHQPKKMHYTVMTEQQFHDSNIDVSSQTKKIVGTICLSKSHSTEGGAWIKRLYVHEQYQRKGVAKCLLNVAVQFAIDVGYNCVDIVASEYTEGGRELCLKNGFELKQIYNKSIIAPFVTILMYELTFQIKLREEDYSPSLRKRELNLKHQ